MISVIPPTTSSVSLIPNLVLPTLLKDIVDKADKWGNDDKNGRIDPFTEIYDVSRDLQYTFCWDQFRCFLGFSSFSP